MNEIFDELPDLLTEAFEPDRYIVADAVKYLIADDLLVFLNCQPKTAESPGEKTPSLATLRRNINLSKENDKK